VEDTEETLLELVALAKEVPGCVAARASRRVTRVIDLTKGALAGPVATVRVVIPERAQAFVAQLTRYGD
jgi:hypothetical protein